MQGSTTSASTEATASGQASEKRRRLDELMNVLQRGDRLVVSSQIVAILDALAKAGIAFVALKENIRVEGKRNIQTNVMTTLFALFAEVERDLISERTREGLARARASAGSSGARRARWASHGSTARRTIFGASCTLGVSKTASAKITGVAASVTASRTASAS